MYKILKDFVQKRSKKKIHQIRYKKFYRGRFYTCTHVEIKTHHVGWSDLIVGVVHLHFAEDECVIV